MCPPSSCTPACTHACSVSNTLTLPLSFITSPPPSEPTSSANQCPMGTDKQWPTTGGTQLCGPTWLGDYVFPARAAFQWLQSGLLHPPRTGWFTLIITHYLRNRCICVAHFLKNKVTKCFTAKPPHHNDSTKQKQQWYTDWRGLMMWQIAHLSWKDSLQQMNIFNMSSVIVSDYFYISKVLGTVFESCNAVSWEQLGGTLQLRTWSRWILSVWWVLFPLPTTVKAQT